MILARAIASEARILILDEPTSALDLQHQSAALGWMRRLSQQDGLTIIFTTHHPHHALAVADDALLMQGGAEYLCGPAQEVLSESNLRQLYGLPIRRIRIEYDGRTIETVVPILS